MCGFVVKFMKKIEVNDLVASSSSCGAGSWGIVPHPSALCAIRLVVGAID